MTPRDKAIDLTQKFEGLVANQFDGKGNIRLNDIVRQRALMCCDEIIGSYDETISDAGLYDGMYDIRLSARDSIKYWRQVKSEIESL